MLNTDHSVGGLPTGGLSVANGPRSRVRDAFDPRLQNSDIMSLCFTKHNRKTTRESNHNNNKSPIGLPTVF